MNYIDTRDLNVRLEELEAIKQRVGECFIEMEECDGDVSDLQEEFDSLTDEFDAEEYDVLNGMRDEIPEWEDGNTLIADCDFVEYVIEMLNDCGYISDDFPSFIDINWESTADNVKIDYSYVEYEGIEYWFRNC